MPVPLAQDHPRKQRGPRLQLEFVVDNLALAEVSNGVAKITNEVYRAPLGRIRNGLRVLFDSAFDYKAGFMDPVDWRSREFNVAADHVANCCCLAQRCDISLVDQKDIT